jgi:methionine-rich copper-binding protein CopC
MITTRSQRALVTLLIAAFVLGTASPTLAHAAYESSDPPNRSTVSSPPRIVTAEFTERVIDGSYLAVYDACGEQVDNGDSFVTADRITVSMSADKRGKYTVRFEVVSAVDGHPTEGEFFFTSSGGNTCAATEPRESRREAPEKVKRAPPTAGSDRARRDSQTQVSESRASGGDSVRAVRTRRNREKVRAGPARGGARKKGRKPRANEIEAVSVPAEVSPQTPGLFDDFLWGLYAISLAMAALIGAAGGLIYAGIMGYTPVRKTKVDS